MTGPYDDIIHLPHHVSATRPRMPRENRAAQFAPFAALTGFEQALSESARQTDTRMELNEDAIAALDMKLRILADHIDERPEVAVTYFQPDGKKEGGAYVTATAALKRIDTHERVLLLADGSRIAIRDVLEIDCALFAHLG